jgi:Flp pilus assembly protein TadD
MKTSLMLKLGPSALLLGFTAVGCTTASRPASLSSASPKADRQAARLARSAGKALAAKRIDQAVPLAERAVTLSPRDASYRAMLGQAYVRAGRFTSAEATFADATALDPNPRNRFNLALTQIALGKWDVARGTLASLNGQMPDADIGLATALAGDKEGGVAILERAVRAPDAGVKARQNLALVYAMVGRWTDAQAIAQHDVPPDQLAVRFAQWAKFAQPTSSWDQVATLLGVTPVQDPGRPVALALAASAADEALAAAPVVATPAPQAVAEVEPVAVPASAVVPVAYVAPAAPVVSAPPAPRIAPVRPALSAPSPVRTAVVRPRQVSTGKWVVQLGSYAQATSVDTAWGRFTARVRALAGYAPTRSTFVATNGTVHRLTLSGFATRNDAIRACQSVKARRGECFVRQAAGEQPIQWATRPVPTRIAMR